jgi:alpha-beta hydrolase superfamily lysophospholipase
VVILPGLGNNSKDYEGLVEQLQQRGLHVEVAPVNRIDW